MSTEERRFIRAAAFVLSLFVGGLLVVTGGARKIYDALPEAGVTKQNRADAEWEKYKVEQQCALTGNTQTSTTYGGTHLTRHSSTRTMVEWKCRGGDIHWR